MDADKTLAKIEARSAKETALAEKVAVLRDLWMADGRPEYDFTAAMMEIYAGTFPCAYIGKAA